MACLYVLSCIVHLRYCLKTGKYKGERSWLTYITDLLFNTYFLFNIFQDYNRTMLMFDLHGNTCIIHVRWLGKMLYA